jgi:mono/diheme cytochrome c family protein
MIIWTTRNVLILWILLGLIASTYAGQEKQVKKSPVPPSNPPSGAELYKQRCAVCHGDDLKRSGRFPSPYRVPPDLTTLARRHGGKFPDAYVSSVLRNGVKLPAHGPAEMPVWGTDFEATDKLDKTQVALRIKSLTDYIESLQVK